MFVLLFQQSSKHKVIIMLQGNTQLYHDHILSNIQSLEKRKNGYVSHRLQFIQESCEPLLTKIKSLKSEIKHYQDLRTNQHSIIETNEQIVKLKKEIYSYSQTNKYYDNRLDEFDRFIAQLEINLQQSRRYLETQKQKYKLMITQSGKSLKFIKSQANRLTNNKILHQSDEYNFNASITSQSNLNQEQEIASSITNSKVNIDNYGSINKSIILNNLNQSALKLPQIHRYQTSNREYGQKIKRKLIIRHNRNQIRLQKFIQQFSPHQSLSQSVLTNTAQEEPITLNPNSIKEIKKMITQFDHTQALFRNCFERKKLMIQKSVSQLQPKLISNKDLFMQACEKIGQKQNTMTFENFSLLSTDQIATLFVSFGWLNRKIYSQFSQKRKNIIKVLKIIKNFQQTN